MIFLNVLKVDFVEFATATGVNIPQRTILVPIWSPSRTLWLGMEPGA